MVINYKHVGFNSGMSKQEGVMETKEPGGRGQRNYYHQNVDGEEGHWSPPAINNGTKYEKTDS